MKGTDRDLRSHGGRWLAAVSLGLLALNSHAAKTFPGFLAEVSGQSTTVAAASNGTLVAVKAPGTLVAGGGWTLAGNYGVAAGTAGAVKVGADAAIPVAGKTVGVQVAGSISKADIAAAAAGCIGGGIPGCVATAVPLAIAYLSLSGARLSPTVPGQLERRPTGFGYCYTAPCYEFKAVDNSYRRSADEACKTFNATQWALNDVDGRCYFPPSGVLARVLERRSATVMSPTWYPATEAEVVAQLLADAANNPPITIVPELQKAGVDWNAKWVSPVVTGPSTVKSPEEVVSRPDGTTTTKQTTTPLTYSGPKVTAGPSVTTQIDRNSSGVTTGTTTTTTNPGTEADKPPAEDPPTQCDKYPNTLGCSELDTPEAEIPKESKTITYTPETPFGGGSCPADKYFSSGLAGRNFKAIDWVQWCSYAPTIRLLVILLAGISAFFIVSLGRDAE